MHAVNVAGATESVAQHCYTHAVVGPVADLELPTSSRTLGRRPFPTTARGTVMMMSGADPPTIIGTMPNHHMWGTRCSMLKLLLTVHMNRASTQHQSAL